MTDPLFDDSKTRLPYGGTSGRGGSEASAEAKGHEDADGTTGYRQRETLGAVGNAGPNGLTIHELSSKKGWHHGQASSQLSILHKTGDLARLTERRAGQSVYVLPEYVEGRPVAARTTRVKRGTQLQRVVVDETLHKQLETYAAGAVIDAPVSAPRPSLSPEEDDLRQAVTQYLAGLSDQPIVRMKRPTVLSLLAMIKKLEG